MKKNVASQDWRVFAFNVDTGLAETGDAAQITAKIEKDFGGLVATNDTNPTEREAGYYLFDLTQAETNADDLFLVPVSSTASIQVVGVPGNLVPVPVAFADLHIQAGGAVNSVGTVNTKTGFAPTTTEVRAVSLDANQDYDAPTEAEMNARTIVAASYFDPAADTVHLGASALADVQSEVDTALATYDAPTEAEMNARTLVAASYFSASADTVHLGASALTDVQGEVTTALNSYDGPTNAEMEARTIVAANYFDFTTDTIQVGGTSKTGYTLGTDGITAAAVSAAAGAKVADIGARRTLANIEASSDGDALSLRSQYGAACKMVNKISISGTTLTITKVDDTTALGTQAVTTNVLANPITALDTD